MMESLHGRKEFVVILVSCALLMIGGLYVFVRRQLPQETWTMPRGENFDALQEEVRPGDKLNWKGYLCRHDSEDFEIQRFILNVETQSKVLIDLNQTTPIRKGECARVEREALVPLHTPPGRSVEVSKYTSFRRGQPFHEVEFRTDEFMVLPVDK